MILSSNLKPPTVRTVLTALTLRYEDQTWTAYEQDTVVLTSKVTE